MRERETPPITVKRLPEPRKTEEVPDEPLGKEWWEIEEERFARIEEEQEDEGFQRSLRGLDEAELKG